MKQTIIKIGYNTYIAVSIIRRAKQIMLKKGCACYNNLQLGHLPIGTVEDIFGVPLLNNFYLYFRDILIDLAIP